MFNVVSSTALNLNGLGNPSSYDHLLYFFGCVQWNGLLICMELAPKIRLQPLCVNFERPLLWMRNLCPSMWKRFGHCERSRPSRPQFPRKKFETEIKQEDLLPRLEFLPGNMFIVPGCCSFFVNAGILISFIPEFI